MVFIIDVSSLGILMSMVFLFSCVFFIFSLFLCALCKVMFMGHVESKGLNKCLDYVVKFLIPLLRENILPDTTIYSVEWKTYKLI
jgi:hypothetical protein